MKVVAALGGNTLLERGESPDSDIQEAHVQRAARARAAAEAPRCDRYHGNGPQVGVLALESDRDARRPRG